jgi:hypothetical protein
MYNGAFGNWDAFGRNYKFVSNEAGFHTHWKRQPNNFMVEIAPTRTP